MEKVSCSFGSEVAFSLSVGIVPGDKENIPSDFDRFDGQQDIREFIHPFIDVVTMFSTSKSEDHDVGQIHFRDGMRCHCHGSILWVIRIVFMVDVSEVDIEVGDTCAFGIRETP